MLAALTWGQRRQYELGAAGGFGGDTLARPSVGAPGARRYPARRHNRNACKYAQQMRLCKVPAGRKKTAAALCDVALQRLP